MYLLLEVNKDLQAAYELNAFLEAFDEMREGERRQKEEYGAEHELHLKQEACDTETPEKAKECMYLEHPQANE